jgi:hypothetical protein
MPTASDVSLARALEQGGPVAGGFPHASHVRVACVLLSQSGTLEEAEARMAAGLRRFATAAGQPQKYHHTLTLFWVRIVAAAGELAGTVEFDAVTTRVPALLDTHLPLVFYTRERLDAGAARQEWVEPDRHPISIDAVSAGTAAAPGDTPGRPLSR